MTIDIKLGVTWYFYLKLWVWMTSCRDSTPTLRCLIGKTVLAKENKKGWRSQRKGSSMLSSGVGVRKYFKKEEVFNCVRCYLEIKKDKYSKKWLFEKYFNSYIPFYYCLFLPYIRNENTQGHKTWTYPLISYNSWVQKG